MTEINIYIFIDFFSGRLGEHDRGQKKMHKRLAYASFVFKCINIYVFVTRKA